MGTPLKQFVAAAQRFSLSTEEKASLRRALDMHMVLHPQGRDVVGGDVRALIHPSGRFSVGRVEVLLKRSVAAVSTFALLGASVAYAAESALPGDFLYPVKVDITEHVRSSLDFTRRSQAERALWQAERRLGEISTLVAAGQLTRQGASDVFERLAHQTKVLRARLSELSTGGETQVAADLGAELESTLDAHEEVLKNLALRMPAASPVDTLVSGLHIEGQAALRQRIVVEEALNRQGRSGMQNAALQGIKAAGDTIQDARVLLDRVSRKNQNAVATASLRLAVAEKILRDAHQQFDQKSFTQASTLSQSALRLGKQAELLGRVAIMARQEGTTRSQPTVSRENDAATAARTKDIDTAAKNIDALRSLMRKEQRSHVATSEADARLTTATQALDEVRLNVQQLWDRAEAQVLLEEAKNLTDDARKGLELNGESHISGGVLPNIPKP